MRRFGMIAAAAWLLAGCWQAAGIDVIDLPVRDGQSDDGGLDADAADEAAVEEQDALEQPEIPADFTPPDPAEDPAAEDVRPDAPPTGMSAEAYCRGLLEAMCVNFERCCSAVEYGSIQDVFGCDTDTGGQYYDSCVGTYGPMVAAGWLVIDEASFPSCSAAIQGPDTQCLGFTAFIQAVNWILETACSAMFVGRVLDGGNCNDRMECASGGCCIEGRCMSCRSSGEACSDNSQCPAQRRCIGGTCREVSGEGEPCDVDDELSFSDCGSRYWCNEGECRELLGQDEQCPDPSVMNYGCSGLCLDLSSCSSFCGPP
jgi:hypothetical protein